MRTFLRALTIFVILGLLPIYACVAVFPRHVTGVTLIGALCYGLAFCVLLIGGIMQRFRYRDSAAGSFFSAVAALLLFFWLFLAYRTYRDAEGYFKEQRAEQSR